MGKKLKVIMLLILSVLLSFGAGCTDTGRFAVSGKAGTLGLGGEFTTGITSNVNARVGLNTLNLDFDDQELGDVEYDLGIDLYSFSALVDWYIFDGPFHISGGALSFKNEIDLHARPTESIKIGDTEYTPAQIGTLTGGIEIGDLAPYVGIGWGNPLTSSRRWGFTFDLGVAFINAPDVSLSATGTVAQADLERERKDIEDALKPFEFYPVISLGLFFRF